MTFEVRARGTVHVYDSVECAIHAIAPIREHCACRVLGDGVQVSEQLFYCAQRAAQGHPDGGVIVDRAG